MKQQSTYPAGQWLDRATAGIRFGPDRREVREELSAHLEDKALDFQRIFPELTEAEAKERAAAEMGDPEEVGRELARIHKPWLGYLWRASQVLAGLLLAYVILTGAVWRDLCSTVLHPSEPEELTGIPFVLEEAPLTLGQYRVWVEDAALDPETGELTIVWRAVSRRFWEPVEPVDRYWTAQDDQGTWYISAQDGSYGNYEGSREPYVPGTTVSLDSLVGWRWKTKVRGVPQDVQWIQLNVESGGVTTPVVLEREEETG